ncbi:hypothetical protein GA0115252_13281, partial [Streptomyces sp. DfronAA-171]
MSLGGAGQDTAAARDGGEPLFGPDPAAAEPPHRGRGAAGRRPRRR